MRDNYQGMHEQPTARSWSISIQPDSNLCLRKADVLPFQWLQVETRTVVKEMESKFVAFQQLCPRIMHKMEDNTAHSLYGSDH